MCPQEPVPELALDGLDPCAYVWYGRVVDVVVLKVTEMARVTRTVFAMLIALVLFRMALHGMVWYETVYYNNVSVSACRCAHESIHDAKCTYLHTWSAL